MKTMARRVEVNFSGRLGLLLILIVPLSFSKLGHTQEAGRTMELRSSLGMMVFDKKTGFNSAASFGLSIGQRVTRSAQVTLGFAVNSLQQSFSTPDSKVDVDLKSYSYFLNLYFSGGLRFVPRFKPFWSLGLGGIVFDPQAITLNLGGGEHVRVDSTTDHKLFFNFGGGLRYSLGKRLAAQIEYLAVLFRTVDAVDFERHRDSVTARNHYFGLSLSTSL